MMADHRLNCTTCSKLEGDDCPIEYSTDQGYAEHISKICGLACHSNTVAFFRGE